MNLFAKRESEADAIERKLHERMMALRQQERERKLRRGRRIASAIRWFGFLMSAVAFITGVMLMNNGASLHSDSIMWLVSALGGGFMLHSVAAYVERETEAEHGSPMELFTSPYYAMDQAISSLFLLTGVVAQIPLLYGFIVPLLKSFIG